MRLIEVLPDYDAKRFGRPPALTSNDRKKYFKIDDSIRAFIDKAKQPDNQIGLLVQYGYFKVCGKFFTTKNFKPADIKAAAKSLGVIPSGNFIENYADRTRQKHRISVLDACGHIEFNSAISTFEEIVTDMVDKQMHPRKLFYVLVEQLRQKKIELPSYDRIARTITNKFHTFEKTVVQTMTNIVSPEQQEALNQLFITEGEAYERALLTRLKAITQSMKPAKIKQGIRNFLIIQKLHKELIPVVEKLVLSAEATRYYSQWVTKAKITQIAEMVEVQKRNLYLVAFIDHGHKLWQDSFVDMLLKAVQQQLNKAEREVGLMIKERLPEKNKLTSSVLTGFNDATGKLDKIRVVVHDQALSNDDKILKLYKIIPHQENVIPLSQAELGEYSTQHPLQEALKEFERIIKSVFILKYVDDMEWRQAIEKQLNKGELANKFSAAISFADQNLLESLKEDQEIAVMCKTIIQNIIILWNYVELTKIIMRSDPDERIQLLERITSASILTWQHVNLHGPYDFSNLLCANDPDYTLDDMINFKSA